MLQILMAFLLTFSVTHYNTDSLLHPSVTSESLQNGEAFRLIKVTKEKMKYIITGEVRLKKGELHYVVEDGHNELIPATKKRIKSSFSHWSKFELEVKIPKENIPFNGSVILYFFEVNNDNKRVHTYPVILEEI